MRIGFIHQYYAPDVSAVGNLAASLAEHRARLGDEVTVVASRGGYVPQAHVEKRSTQGNPRVHRMWTPRFGKRKLFQRLIDYGAFYTFAAGRMVTLPRQDLIILLTLPPFIGWTGVLHQILHRRTKLLLWNMDCYPEAIVRAGLLKRNGIADRTMRAMNHALFRQVDHVVCLDDAMVQLLDSQYGVCKSMPVTVIPNWEPESIVALDASHPRRPPAVAWGLSDRFVVVYSGNAGFGHCFKSVIEAARRLRHDPVTFLFLGGGNQWPWLEAQKRQYRLDQLHLQSYLPCKEQAVAVMKTADFALITLKDEMLGVMSPSKLHSNLAAGLPILYVGPPGSNVDVAIRRFQCGVSFRHGDVDGIVNAVRSALNQSEQHHMMKQRARAAFEQAYCDTVTLPQFDRVIDKLFAPRVCHVQDLSQGRSLRRAA